MVITGRDTSSEVYSVLSLRSSPIIGLSSVEIVQGVAVWIEPEKTDPYAEETDPYVGKKKEEYEEEVPFT